MKRLVNYLRKVQDLQIFCFGNVVSGFWIDVYSNFFVVDVKRTAEEKFKSFRFYDSLTDEAMEELYNSLRDFLMEAKTGRINDENKAVETVEA